jgi:RimJ/RimL family protein N-acetyltransferase
MAWRLTEDLGEFTAAAGPYLRSDPVRNTVPLTVLAALERAGLATFGESPPVFGWHAPASSGTASGGTASGETASGGTASGATDGVFLWTPPMPLLVAGMPAGSADSLAGLLTSAGRTPREANVPAADAAGFSAAWAGVTGGSSRPRMRMRLHRLAELCPPDPWPPGAARLAGQADFGLLVRWSEEFVAETRAAGEDAARMVTDQLDYGGLTVWEDSGQPVAMASLSPAVAGVCRVSSVYTPAAHRQRGYGAAVTTTVSRQALEAGAAEVVLYTDVANRTSNALYERLGYRPVTDRVHFELRLPVTSPRPSSSQWS